MLQPAESYLTRHLFRGNVGRIERLAWHPVVVPSDHFLCYKTALAKGQPKFLAASKSLKDQFGGSESFDVKAVISICNPADKNNEGTRFPEVHEEGFKIAAPKGAPKFVKSDHITVDQFGTLSLTISGPATLLDVTPKAIGAAPLTRSPAIRRVTRA